MTHLEHIQKDGGETMLERIARAMCEADGFKWEAAHFGETANGDDPDDQREYWRDKAAAAVSAMRVPTHALTVVGQEATGIPWGFGTVEAGMCWQAMIDAILADKDGGEG